MISLSDLYIISEAVNHRSTNETALTSKQRNALPDDAFGLPKLREYPLVNADHVVQAVRMFSHCKKEDRQTLANAIINKIEEYKLKVKVGKENPLYEYVPEKLKKTKE